MSLAQFFGIDKLQKLARMVKEHGGVKASLYHFYLTDDLKVGQLGRNVVSSGVDPGPVDPKELASWIWIRNFVITDPELDQDIPRVDPFYLSEIQRNTGNRNS